MAIDLSTATEDELAEFCEGSCHVFALALHRLTGWVMHAVLDLGEPYWIDPEDDDNFIPAVAHVFCVDGEGRFWDIRGCRPASDVHSEMTDWLDFNEYGSEDLHDEDSLRTYVGYWSDEGDPIDRPLWDYAEEDISAAESLIRRVLAGVRGSPFEAQVQPAL